MEAPWPCTPEVSARTHYPSEGPPPASSVLPDMREGSVAWDWRAGAASSGGPDRSGLDEEGGEQETGQLKEDVEKDLGCAQTLWQGGGLGGEAPNHMHWGKLPSGRRGHA